MMPQSQFGMIIGNDVAFMLWIFAALVILAIILSTHKKGGD